ncbi:MAG: DUF6206 family protein [Acidimicrobiales bacterium]
MPTNSPSLSDDALEAAEAAISRGIRRRSTKELRVLGFGELGVAVAWPSEHPAVVCKRQTPTDRAAVVSDHERTRAYHASLQAAGVNVLSTDLRRVDRADGSSVAYHVQPIIPADQLVENILARSTPAADHPVITAVRELVTAVVRDTPALGRSVDAQVSNFGWIDNELVLLDTTPQLLWTADDGPFYDVGNYLDALPALLRPAALRITRRTGDIYRTVRGTLSQTAVYLHRIDLGHWVEPALEAFNDVLDDPITVAEVERGYTRMKRDLPTLKRMARVQRMWVERVRRSDYEWFITNSFTGEIL